MAAALSRRKNPNKTKTLKRSAGEAVNATAEGKRNNKSGGGESSTFMAAIGVGIQNLPLERLIPARRKIIKKAFERALVVEAFLEPRRIQTWLVRWQGRAVLVARYSPVHSQEEAQALTTRIKKEPMNTTLGQAVLDSVKFIPDLRDFYHHPPGQMSTAPLPLQTLEKMLNTIGNWPDGFDDEKAMAEHIELEAKLRKLREDRKRQRLRNQEAKPEGNASEKLQVDHKPNETKTEKKNKRRRRPPTTTPSPRARARPRTASSTGAPVSKRTTEAPLRSGTVTAAGLEGGCGGGLLRATALLLLSGLTQPHVEV